MANNKNHTHPVVDTDSKHFVIDPITRTIKNETSKLTLIKNDHNSERFTFEIPKEIEGHDMAQSNLIEIHFINVNSQRRNEEPSKGVYVVQDFAVSDTDPTKYTFSWLLSGLATKYVGTLNFSVRFACTTPNEDGGVDYVYSWNTGIHTGINVVDSIDNSDVVIPLEVYSDIVAAFQQDILTLFNNQLAEFTTDFNEIADEVLAKEPVSIDSATSGTAEVSENKTVTPVTIIKTDGTTTTFNVEAQNGKDAQGLIGLEVVNGHLIVETNGAESMNFNINDEGELEITF